jgi:hypothetical protein
MQQKDKTKCVRFFFSAFLVGGWSGVCLVITHCHDRNTRRTTRREKREERTTRREKRAQRTTRKEKRAQRREHRGEGGVESYLQRL